MAKSVLPAVLDASLSAIAAGTTMTVCSAQPTTRTQAVTTYALASATMTAGAGNGDWTLANGDVSGRKVTTTIKSNVPVTTTGTANHIAICDATNLLFVTTCTSQGVTSGNTVTIPAWKIEITNPS